MRGGGGGRGAGGVEGSEGRERMRGGGRGTYIFAHGAHMTAGWAIPRKTT